MSADPDRHGGDMAVPIPTDCHRWLHRGEVVLDPTLHRGAFRSGVRSYCGGGLLLSPGGNRTGQAHQTSNLGHRRPGALQVHLSDAWLFLLLWCCNSLWPSGSWTKGCQSKLLIAKGKMSHGCSWRYYNIHIISNGKTVNLKCHTCTVHLWTK